MKEKGEIEIMLKMLVVGVNHSTKKIVLKAYAAKDIQNEVNPDGLTYEGILGTEYSLMYVGDRKCDCLTYISKNNFEEYKIVDDTDRVVVKGYRVIEEV